ncbi:MAG: poly-gamma-glutamate synthase PgsB [Candidatus Aminicenantales bacterium]
MSACLVAFLLYLAGESLRLRRALRRVPLRVAVAGTRGKSGVTRLIAAGLRESGARVLAKTTGSRPALILPDGTERGFPRRGGPPSIREQVRLAGLAAGLKADALVTEMMSVGEECLFTESRRILRPGVLALTNVRLDHVDAMGRSREDIARTLSAAFPESAPVFFPAEESRPVFEEAAGRLGARLKPVSDKIEDGAAIPFGEFEPNVRLALAVLESLGVERGRALGAMSRALPDFGGLRLWTVAFGTPPRTAICASAFAANDPESSAAALEQIKTMLPTKPRPLVGLLCLREDRGDRTLQWVQAAGAGFFGEFERVAVVGGPARAAARKLRGAVGPGITKFSFFANPLPEDLMDKMVAPEAREHLVVGLGNIVGPGERIVSYWEDVGRLLGR